MLRPKRHKHPTSVSSWNCLVSNILYFTVVPSLLWHLVSIDTVNFRGSMFDQHQRKQSKQLRPEINEGSSTFSQYFPSGTKNMRIRNTFWADDLLKWIFGEKCKNVYLRFFDIVWKITSAVSRTKGSKSSILVYLYVLLIYYWLGCCLQSMPLTQQIK